MNIKIHKYKYEYGYKYKLRYSWTSEAKQVVVRGWQGQLEWKHKSIQSCTPNFLWPFAFMAVNFVCMICIPFTTCNTELSSLRNIKSVPLDSLTVSSVMEYLCTYIQVLDNHSISFPGKCLKIWKSPSKCENSKCVHLQLKPLECFSRALKAQVLKFPTLSLGKILCVPFSSAKLKRVVL